MKPQTYRSACAAWRILPGGLFLALLLLAHPALGQGFNAGSDGSLGDVIISSNTTVALPADGKLNYHSLVISNGAALTFTRNARNTPVYVLSQTEIVVDGTISVDGGSPTANTGGLAGPGGFDGGKPGFGADSPPGDGYGPGAGRAGDSICSDPTMAQPGSYGTQGRQLGGPTYGNTLLIPLVGGSGGGGASPGSSFGGGGGGGAILLAANNRVSVSGTIFARGGNNSACVNGGSGGAIRLVSFKVEGNGVLNANGGTWGGAGRVRIDTVIRIGLNFNISGVSSIGGNLLVFPPAVPVLNVTSVAGNVVPLGSDPLVFNLPFGSPTNQVVSIQARDFGRTVPIRVTLTPDSGPSTSFDAQIDNTTVNPASVDVPVTVPINTVVTVNCWTR